MSLLITHIPGVARTAAAAICLLLTGAATSYAMEWRGIVPLHSTRADVERLLGKPTKGFNEDESFYDLPEEVAVIWFETTGCEGDTVRTVCDWGWNVPRDTVTSIGVVYKRPQVFELDSVEGFQKEASCDGLTYYSHKKEGLEVETYKGAALSATYSPTEAADNLLCPKRESGYLLHCPHSRKFDEYGNIRWEDEIARLDNVAVALQNAPNLRLAILAYGGRRNRPDEAIKRAERARRYLVGVRNISPWQVVTASCGYRDESTVELLPHGIGAWRIYASPTVDPSEVTPRAQKKSRRR